MRLEGAGTEDIVKATLERVKKTRHPIKGLATVLFAVIGYLVVLVCASFLVNWIVS